MSTTSKHLIFFKVFKIRVFKYFYSNTLLQHCRDVAVRMRRIHERFLYVENAQNTSVRTSAVYTGDPGQIKKLIRSSLRRRRKIICLRFFFPLTFFSPIFKPFPKAFFALHGLIIYIVNEVNSNRDYYIIVHRF